MINNSQGSNMHPVPASNAPREVKPVHVSASGENKRDTRPVSKPEKQRRLKFYQPLTNNLQVGSGSALSMFQISKTASKKFGTVKSFAANTHLGLVRKTNEDRIAIILNVI